MSKARLIITAVVVEGRTQAEVAREYGVSKGWVSKLVKRYHTEGNSAFEPRSRRPHTSPNRTPASTVDLIVGLRRELTEQGLYAGTDTIVWHLKHHHHITLSPSTVHRYLRAHGLVEPQPKKRPHSSYIRFEAEQPNETWQSDFTHYRLADGTNTEIITWLDDHSRYALSVTAHPRVTGKTVLNTFRETYRTYGKPSSTLTDNGMVYTTRWAGGRGGRNTFEHELADLRITQKNSRPSHPTTCGKVERFQQTLKKWLRAQPAPETLNALNTLIAEFLTVYNHQRPHRSLPNQATPHVAYTSRPKASPEDTPDNPHYRVRHDRVSKSGTITLRHNSRLHHIGLGKQHVGTAVIALVNNLHIRIINATTGELLRELTLNPHQDYQPTGKPPGPPPKKKTPKPTQT